jgi:prevent-host-death family protein
MIIVMTTASLTDVKAHLSAYVDSVVRTHERVFLTRQGRRDAVLLSADDLDGLEETLAILSDNELVADLAAARAEAAAGLATIERPVVGVPHRAT